MPKDDEYMDIKKFVEDTKAVSKDLVPTMKVLTDTLNEYKEVSEYLGDSIRMLQSRMYDVHKELKKVNGSIYKQMRVSQTMEGGFLKMYGRLGSGLTIKPEQVEAIKKTWFGRMMLRFLEMYKELYLLFPSLGYAGVRIMSRVVRSLEAYSKAYTAREELKEKLGLNRNSMLKSFSDRLISSVQKTKDLLRKSKVGRVVLEKVEPIKTKIERVKIPFLRRKEREEGKEEGGVLKPSFFTFLSAKFGMLGSGIAAVFLTLQSALASIKVIGFVFSDAVKGVMEVIRMFKMAISLALKPMFDILTLTFLPIAMFFLVLFSNFYKYMTTEVLGKYYRDLQAWIEMAIDFADKVSSIGGGIRAFVDKVVRAIVFIANLLSNFGGSVKEFLSEVGSWLADTLIASIKEFFSPISDKIKDIGGFVSGFFDSLGEALSNFFTEKFNGLKNSLGDLKGKVEDFFGDFETKVKSAITSLSSWLDDNLIAPLISFFDPLLSPIKEAVDWIKGKFDGLLGGVGNIGDKIVNGVKDVFGFQSGGYVLRTGLYKLHAGEYVLPRWNVAKGGSEVTNNYTIHIDVHGNANEDIAEEIMRRLRFELGIGGA